MRNIIIKYLALNKICVNIASGLLYAYTRMHIREKSNFFAVVVLCCWGRV